MIRYKHLETTKTRHGKRAIYFRRGKGERIRLPDDIQSEAFRMSYFAALRGTPIPHVRTMAPTKAERQMQDTESALKAAVGSAAARSKVKGRAFDLTLDWALETVAAQGFKCALTGIPFFAEHPSGGRVAPYIPSIDRIDNQGGYTQSNVRIVVFAINAMMLDWGSDVFEAVANAYRYTRGRTRKERSIPAPEMRMPAP